MAIYKVVNESTAPEPEDALKEAYDYLNGCLEGSYEIDEELLEACVDVVNENTDVVTVDDYNTVMESVEYLQEAYTKKAAHNKLNRYLDKKYRDTGDKGLKDLENRIDRKDKKADKAFMSGKLSFDEYDKHYDKSSNEYSKGYDKIDDYHNNKLDHKVKDRERKIIRKLKGGKISYGKAMDLKRKLDDYADKREDNYYKSLDRK